MPVCLRRVVLLVAVLIGMPVVAAAQNDSHWGISGSFTPMWKSVESLRKFYIEGEGELEGKEFTIGFVRGSTRGGDWGVSFVHKPFTDGVTIVDPGEDTGLTCTGTFCTSSFFSSSDTMRDVKLTGVEFHWFKPFVTIAERIQIGLNLAGGVAQVKGTVEETFTFRTRVTNNGVVINDINDIQTDLVPAEDVLRGIWGLGKVEGQVAIIVAPAFKIKISGGMNMPAAASFRVGGVVLFSAD
jgi:hypothetical protein